MHEQVQYLSACFKAILINKFAFIFVLRSIMQIYLASTIERGATLLILKKRHYFPF